ncbi:MAG: hypothetical protein FJ096_05865 [Deltaproteobacteria bacterium]|nr:hypothetical protein [Deltaproteobacteria bacterium]
MTAPSDPAPLDAPTRHRIREAQLAWFVRWLDGDEARATWVSLVSRGRAVVLAARPADLIDREALPSLVERWLARERIEASVAPVAEQLLIEITRRATLRDESTTELVGFEARRRVEQVAADPLVVSEALVRALLAGPVLEKAVSDLLFEAVDGFSRKVNPFSASWGLPALLDTLPLLGRGAIKMAVQGLQQEFERRLEPETRRFLAGFVRQSLDRAAREVTTRGPEPDLVRLRTELAAAAMSVPLSDLVWSPETTLGKHALAAVRAALVGLAANPVFRDELSRALTQHLDSSESIGAICAQRGIDLPDDAELAAALWPGVRKLLNDAEVMATLRARLDDSLRSLG